MNPGLKYGHDNTIFFMGVTLKKIQDKTYFPELDVLRFFAFLLVFIHHTPVIMSNSLWLRVHNYGWMGVDLFLCLSAFLFTKLLYTEYQRTGTINIPYFYVRRTLRIWPLYYFFVISMIVLGLFNKNELQSLYARAAGMFTFTDNLFAAYTAKYNPFPYMAHLWTIAYEEQFYAIIPWALRYLFQKALRAKLLILSTVVILGFLLRALFIWLQVPHPAIWVLPITHFDSILFGLFVGLGLFDPILNKIPWSLTGLAGCAALMAVSYLPSVEVASWNLMLTYPLTGLGAALLLHAVLRAGNSPYLRWLFNRPLAFLGKISYGLYVYHLLAIGIASQVFKIPITNDWIRALVVFVLPLLLTIIMSSISYLWLEKPFLRIKDRFAIISSRPA